MDNNNRQFAEGHNVPGGNMNPGFVQRSTMAHDTIPQNQPHMAPGSNTNAGIAEQNTIAHNTMPRNEGHIAPGDAIPPTQSGVGIPPNPHEPAPAAHGHGHTGHTAPGSTVDAAAVHHQSAPAHQTSSVSSGAKVGEKIKGMASMGHGIGETLRGNINAAIDTAVGSTSGQEKNERIARQGHEEFARGNARSEQASGRPYGNH